MKTLAIQSVLYNPSPQEVERLFQCLACLWKPKGWRVEIRTGDCGTSTVFPDSLRSRLEGEDLAWSHVPFEANLGFGKGHNRLFQSGPSDRVWLVNPDALFARDTLIRLMEFADERTGWGIVEPRLSPLEHPKAVDFETYETGWCSGCAPLVDSQRFAQIGGFDEGFFLYGEDVDLSWRMKAAGGKLYCCPWASVYHSRTGEASETERFWGQVSELLLLKKYQRKGHLQCRLADLSVGDQAWFGKVLQASIESLERLGTAANREVEAASWSGRLNSPLRWGDLPLNANAVGFSGDVRIKGGGEDDVVESALGAWAAEVDAISSETLTDRLPFELSESAAEVELRAGQVPFRDGLPPEGWLKVFTTPCGEGWLATGIEAPQGRVSGTQRELSASGSQEIHDTEGWRFVVRRMRALYRLRRLANPLAAQIRLLLT